MNMATDLKQALVGFHAFTGNDYVSSFFIKVKTASWKKMVKDEKYIQEFQEFGCPGKLHKKYLKFWKNSYAKCMALTAHQ